MYRSIGVIVCEYFTNRSFESASHNSRVVLVFSWSFGENVMQLAVSGGIPSRRDCVGRDLHFVEIILLSGSAPITRSETSLDVAQWT
jgi:hypothetical protein